MTRRLLLAATALLLGMGGAAAYASMPAPAPLVRELRIHYRAHDGASRSAIVVLPAWYGPRRNPPIPLVISPHGSGIEPAANARRWGNLPALDRFAVVNPEGQGAKLELYSWGSPGQIADLARMPQILRRALPWLRIAPRRLYAVGASMGGQEVLLLAAQHPHLLAGAASFDAPTNMAARYRAFPVLHDGSLLRALARREFGGTPISNREYWADRSPIDYARALAFSGVPLQIWWSTRDHIVVHQARQSGLLYRTIRRLNPGAPVTEVVGTWSHASEMHAHGALPAALARLGLLPGRPVPPAGVLGDGLGQAAWTKVRPAPWMQAGAPEPPSRRARLLH
jgi:poly(3-hydroxybutyrate) depolymerase